MKSMKRIRCNCLGGILILMFTVAMAGADQGQPAKKETVGKLTGQFLIEDGKPLPKGVVVLFNVDAGAAPDVGTTRRMPDSVEKVDAEGQFAAKAPAGKYYLAGRPDVGGRNHEPGGPPRPDAKIYWARNAQGELLVFELKANSPVDAGVISGVPATGFGKITDEASAKLNKTHTIIEGSVMDTQGNPIAGVTVLATGSPKESQPDFMSEPTREDGFFRLIIPAGKEYYLTPRERFGTDSPEAANALAFQGDKTPMAVQGKPGELVQDIDIVLQRHM